MGQGLCCCKCEAFFGKKSDRHLQDEYRGGYRHVERYRDEPIEKYTDEEPAGIVDDSMLSEGQIRDIVQQQVKALQELDQKLNDETVSDDAEEEAFLDEVRRSSPQHQFSRADDPAKALLDFEAATQQALGKLEGEMFGENATDYDGRNGDFDSDYSGDDDDAFELNVDHTNDYNIDVI